MLNYIFAFIILLSVIWSFFTGQYKAVLQSGLDSAYSTIELMFTILSSMCIFNGMIKVLDEAGVVNKLSRLLRKPLKFLFKDVKDDKAFGIMSMNIGANMLGMGNAATPFGIKAMERLCNGKKYATNAMCLFAVMNTASLQIIPSTILAIRIRYGAANPYLVIVPIWVCSIFGLLVGITAAKLFERRG